METKPTNKKRLSTGWKITLGVIVFIVMANLFGSKEETTTDEPKTETPETPKAKVVNSGLDGSVRQVEKYLKANLNDADSYEPMEWYNVVDISSNKDNPDTTLYKYFVRHRYRAANGFGAKVINESYFYLDKEGNVLLVENAK